MKQKELLSKETNLKKLQDKLAKAETPEEISKLKGEVDKVQKMVDKKNQLKKSYLAARENLANNNQVMEKGVGKGLLRGGLVAGAGLAATYGAKKLYDHFNQPQQNY